MTWGPLLNDRRVKVEPPSKAELDKLRSIVTRSRSDVGAPGLSADTRFVLAYDTARTLALIVVRTEGYGPNRSSAEWSAGRSNTTIIAPTAEVTQSHRPARPSRSMPAP